MEYDGEWWVAYVNEVKLGAYKVSVNFLYPHGPSPSYVFPETTDIQSIVIDIMTC